MRILRTSAMKAEASQKLHGRQIFLESPADICLVLACHLTTAYTLPHAAAF